MKQHANELELLHFENESLQGLLVAQDVQQPLEEHTEYFP
jgi:hypothetical protein